MKRDFLTKILYAFAFFFLFCKMHAQPELPIGMNTGHLNYYTTNIIFTDVMTTASDMFTYYESGPWNSNQIASIPRDTNGYPTEIPYNTGGHDQKIRFLINNYYSGRYYFIYDGTGTISIGGAASGTENGKTYVDLTGEGGHVYVNIESSQSGDHIRNIRILPEPYASDPSSAPTFLEGFLDGLRPFHALRFMEWIHTNNSEQEEWSDRVTKTWYTQGGENGTCFEYAIELCNELQKDAWFCVPHQASDDYIRNFAQLVRDNLDENLNVYIEHSNEMWNWQFDQANYILNNAPGHNNQYVIDDLTSIHPDPWDHPEKDAYMMQRTFRIWTEEFGAQASTRLIRVATGQHAWVDNSRKILRYLFLKEPDGTPLSATGRLSASTGAGCDMFSVAGYFNFNEDQHNYWLDLCENHGTMVSPVEILDSVEARYPREGQKKTLETADYVNSYGVDYAVYEGGQHMQPWMQGEYCYNQSVWDAQIHPDMYDMYMTNFQTHANNPVNCKLFMAFSYVGERESKWGSWGHLESYDQLEQNLMDVAPKYQALLDANVPLEEVDVTGISLDQNTLSIEVGETATLTANIEPSNATNKSVSWTSNEEAMATVSAGVVTAVSEGSVTITATTVDGGFTDSCVVTVSPAQLYTLTVNNGDGDGNYQTGIIVDISADAAPSGQRFAEWTGETDNVANIYSSNTTINMPSENISITATYVDDIIESGVLAIWNFNQAWDDDNINAYSNDGGITTPAISFGPGISPTDNSWYQNAMSGTGITSTNLAEAITDDDYLSFTVTPQSGESVTINSIELRPVSNGERTFALLSSINGFSDGQAIESFTADGNNIAPETIDLTGHNNLNTAVEFRIYIYDHGDVGNEYEQVGLGLGGTENPDHGADDDDLIINGTIGDEVISVTGVSLDQNTMSLVEGNNGNLAANIEPSNATNQGVSWSSNNTSNATVNASGQVTAVAAGQATITVTTDDGSFTDNCVVTVTEAAISVTGVSLDQNTMSLIEGNNGNLAANIQPSNATNQDVTWNSNNTSVATVNASGQVTAVAAGQATITVTTDDGSFTDNCVVTVSVKNNISYTNNNKDIILHPNPATNILILESVIAVKRVIVKNMTGITALDIDYLNNNEIQLDISNLTNGYYILKIITVEGNIIARPFVKGDV